MSSRYHFSSRSNLGTLCGREIKNGTQWSDDRKAFAIMAKNGIACTKCVRKLSDMQDDEDGARSEQVAQENAARELVLHLKRSYK